MDAVSAADRARGPLGLWGLVPPHGRARYLRRAAQAILDEVETLADMLAEHTGMPRTEALLAELLPSVGGLHELADDGPQALRDQRLGLASVLRAGRRTVLVQAPAGVVGVRGTMASPWGEAVLEVAASLLAGNAVVLDPAAPEVGARLAAAFDRTGLPEGLLTLTTDGAALDDACDRVVGGDPEGPDATMLVLDGAPIDGSVSGALWGAFARAGRGPAAVGRIVAVPSVAEPLLRRLESSARALRVGDPRLDETEIGPLASAADVEHVAALVDDAVARGATRVCGGPVVVPGVAGAFFAPTILRGVAPDAALLRERVPGPVLAVVEASSEADAIELASQHAQAVSVWSGDRLHGERVARAIGAEVSWVNEHGLAPPAPPVRLARHTDAQQIVSQPSNLRSARWLPYDPALVRASTTAARLRHGRESERAAVLRSGALPLVRMAARIVRDRLDR